MPQRVGSAAVHPGDIPPGESASSGLTDERSNRLTDAQCERLRRLTSDYTVQALKQSWTRLPSFENEADFQVEFDIVI